MQVVITFEEPGARGGYERLEECGGAGIGGQTEARCAQVGEEAFEETNLGSLLSVWRIRGRGGLTCQTNGRFLRFKRAKIRAKSFQMPDLPAKPSLLRRVDKIGAIV